MDYHKTILRPPRGGFPMKANLVQREPEILRGWEEGNLYGRMGRLGTGAPFVLHDGPPYANGHIHIGTACNKILKDLVVRSRLLDGRPATFRPGWDCHGMPIEHRVLERHRRRGAVPERLALRREAAAFARRHVDVQRAEFRRLGVGGRWEDPYLTLEPAYEAREVRLFARLAADGYIYRGERPIHWCLDCETALAEAEIEYEARRSDSIYVLFTLDGELPGRAPGRAVSFLAWTTTPWTLPANQALAVSPDAEYLLADAGPAGDVIVAAALLPALKEEIGLGAARPGVRFPGARLAGLKARHPLHERSVPVFGADFVSLDEGTGVVHSAPGHGQEDYRLGKDHGLPVYAPVDEQGRFTAAEPAWAGTRVWEANALIVERLRAEEKLLAAGTVSHSYPHCWRCRKPVIFRATAQWFLSLEHRDLRGRLLETARGIDFYPPESKARFLSMLESRPDWCLSRQRAWGVPVPVFFCAGCGEPLMEEPVFERVASVFEREGSDAWFRRPADDFLPPGTACACGGRGFAPSADILDVWFDAGVSWAAVLEPEGMMPADLYLEGSDQHRGWFQASLITAVAATGAPPFRAVLTHGFIVDDTGRKMSKSQGNTVSPGELLKRYGADIIRLWAAGQDYRGDIQVGTAILDQAAGRYRDIRNTIRFMLGNLDGFDPAAETLPAEKLRFVDRWFLSLAAETFARVDDACRGFSFHQATRRLYDFCNLYLSSFYLDILKDRLYTRPERSPERRSARTALYLVARALLGRLAPVLCFTAEEAWGYLPRRAGDPESVHLAPPEDLGSLPAGGARGLTWEGFSEVRRPVTVEIERLRARGEVGHSREASLEIFADDEHRALLELFGDGLAELFVVSEAFLRPAPAGTPALSVTARRTPHPRCPRCWVHGPALGSDPAWPEVCPKCAAALSAAGPDRKE